MLFTATDIQRIFSNIHFTIVKLIAETLGKDYLTQEDITLLKKKGVDLVNWLLLLVQNLLLLCLILILKSF